MKSVRGFACIALVLCLSMVLTDLPGLFPVSNDTLISKKYAGWSGVLRVWYCGGWAEDLPGIINWMNQCADRFEKSNEGAYIQIQSVHSSAMAEICENGILPPDIVLFPPGIFDAPDRLIPLEDSFSIRKEVSETGVYNGITYALPILMSGYAWAYNTDLLNTVPNTWETTDTKIACLPDNDRNYWNAAVVGLCSGVYFPDSKDIDINPTSFDMDLGLDFIETTPAPVQTPVPSTEEQYCSLPESFSIYSGAWSDFLSGSTAAIPVTSYQIRHLKSLSDRGKGPSWKIDTAGDIAFTDQIIFAGIVDKTSDHHKTELCRTFIQCLLSKDNQQALSSTGVFSTTDTPSGYAGHDPYSVLENILRTKKLCPIPAFRFSSKESLNLIVRDFNLNKGFDRTLYHRFLELFY